MRAARRLGFDRTAASVDELLADDGIQAVMIATRHSTHAALAARALRAGKAVFVEKPLALAKDELLDVEQALYEGGHLTVGFNRRFAPLTRCLREKLQGLSGCAVSIRVNAGPLDPEHWMLDPAEGGRFAGEGCHFVDLLAYITNAHAISVSASASPQSNRPLEYSENVLATLVFADGSLGGLLYSGAGDTRLPKERVEVFGAGVAAVLDDFRRLDIYQHGRRTTVKSRQNKGHREEIAYFVDVALGRVDPPSPESYLASTRATLAIVESLRSGQSVSLA